MADGVEAPPSRLGDGTWGRVLGRLLAEADAAGENVNLQITASDGHVAG